MDFTRILCLLFSSLILLSSRVVADDKGFPVSYQLPYKGKEATYSVTLAAAPADNPDWLISTFVAGAARTVNAENQGVFKETWNGLDDNFMPVPEGNYALRGIFAEAKKWKVDGQYHALIPEYVTSPGDSWTPPAAQDQRFPPVHGHVFEPIYDLSVGPMGKAVFLSGYIENWRNPFLVDLNRKVGIDQVVHTWNSSGRSGGQHVAYDGKDVWMIRFNEVYCHTNQRFGSTRTRRGQKIVSLGKGKQYPTDMAVSRGPDGSRLYICEPHEKRITVLDGATGKRLDPVESIEARAIAVVDQRLYILHRQGEHWEIGVMETGKEAKPDLQRVVVLPSGSMPRSLAVSKDGVFYTIRGRQVLGYDTKGNVVRVIGKKEKQSGKYDPEILVHPNKVRIWVDTAGLTRLLVTESGGPMRIGEWSAEDGSLLRHWNLCQNAAGGFCMDPRQPEYIYTTSLNTPELLRYEVNCKTGAWKVDSVWEGLCHRNMEQQFPGGRLFPQLIELNGHRYLCFAGGAFRAYGAWMIYREEGERWLPSAAFVRNRWWHDKNGDGQLQESEFLETPNRGAGTYWAGKYLSDLSIVEIRKGGHAVKRLKPARFDPHGNPVYLGNHWEQIITDQAAEAIRFGKAIQLAPLYGRNEIGDRFWDWSDVTQGQDGSLYVAGVYKPDGITGYKFDEAGQVCAQWKLSCWVPEGDAYRQKWRVGRKAFGPAQPGEVYATMHNSQPVYGLLGMHDGNGLYHVYTTEGLYVDTLMYDRFSFGNMTRGGMYCHSGGSYFGRHTLNPRDDQVYILMGRASNNIYRVPNWKPGLTQPIQLDSPHVQVDASSIVAPPSHIRKLRSR